MPLKLIRADITKLRCDAIVNAAKTSLLGGGGVDGAIHRAAGKELLAACRALGGCEVGQAKLTPGFRLPCRYVIHTVGPVWRGGGAEEEEKLRSCYRSALALAKEYGCESVAFPLISSGAYGYPKDLALGTAADEIAAFLTDNEMLVYLTVYDKASFQIGEKLFDEIAAYIDDNYVEAHPTYRRQAADGYESRSLSAFELSDEACEPAAAVFADAAAPYAAAPAKRLSLDETLKHLDESFSEALLRKIDERGMTDAQCYKKANIDRKLFSKIRTDRAYRPSKQTAIALGIALELPPDELKDLLMKAGYALSRSSKFDVIIEYFITNRNYNIFEINEALFAFDQSLLGA